MSTGWAMAGEAEGTVGKAVEVLDLVASAGQPLRFSQILQQGRFPKATLHRLLQTLTHLGMLAHDPDRQTYAPGLRLVRLAHSAWSQSSLAPLARPHLDALSAATGETIHLAQLDQGQVLYVDKRNAARPVEMFSQAGRVGPAYCTGVGKAMLAHLPPPALQQALDRQSFYRFTPRTLTTAESLFQDLDLIRQTGHACDREEHEPGIICVAVPILGRQGGVIGALSVTSTTARTSLSALETHADRLRQTAARIADEAEIWRFPGQTA